MSKGNDGFLVSFIKINGKSILPPVLNENSRAEMRHYRELAISVGLKIEERAMKKKAVQSESTDVSWDESVEDEFVDDQNEATSPTLTASTDLNQFLDSVLEASPQPSDSVYNAGSSGRLIRSASYTLDQPSVNLLTTVGQTEDASKPSNNMSYCALQPEPKCSDKPSKKPAVIKKKKKTPSPKFSKKLFSRRNTIKNKYKKNNVQSEPKKDDFHIDLDLHLDLPMDLIGPCTSRSDQSVSYIESVVKESQTEPVDISPPKTVLDKIPMLQELQNKETEPDQINHHNTKNIESLNGDKPVNHTEPQVLIQEEQNFKKLNVDSRTNLTESQTCTTVSHSNSAPDFSRPATTQTDPISSMSNESLDQSSHSISDLDESINCHYEEKSSVDMNRSINLAELVNNIQAEYEMKLKIMMEQQEREKQILREQFFKQQEMLMKKLSISSPDIEISPQPPSPPIRSNKGESSTPRKPLPPELHAKFARLPGLVRGYLTRRLMRTERVQSIKATVRETLSLAVHLHGQPPPLHSSDIALHGRLIQQLDQALAEFHDVFFALPLPKRMSLIAVDRERIRRGSSSARSSAGSRLSSATQKARQRRQQQLSPIIGGGGDGTPRSRPRRTRLNDKRTFQKSVPGGDTAPASNGLIAETRARKMSERRASLIKNKRPWR